jgi:hypothetical protein
VTSPDLIRGSRLVGHHAGQSAAHVVLGHGLCSRRYLAPRRSAPRTVRRCRRRDHFAIASGCPNKDEFELAYVYLPRAFSSAFVHTTKMPADGRVRRPDPFAFEISRLGALDRQHQERMPVRHSRQSDRRHQEDQPGPGRTFRRPAGPDGEGSTPDRGGVAREGRAGEFLSV